MLQDSDGFIWVATDAGVSRFDGKSFENFTIDEGLPDNQVIQIYEDKRKRIWFVAFNGELSYFYQGRIYNSANDQTLRLLRFNAVVMSVFHDSKDRLWFGTNKNILYMLEGKHLTSFSSSDPQTQFISTYVTEDTKGQIWTYSNQTIRVFRNGRFGRSNQTLPSSVLNKALLPVRGKILLFIDNGALYQKEGWKIKQLTPINTPVLTKDLGIFHAEGKDLWLSHKTGVIHQNEQGKVKRYLPGIPTVQVLKGNGNLWFATSNGIYMLPQEKNRVFTLNPSKSLPANVIKSIAKDKQGYLWLGMIDGWFNRLNQKTMKFDAFKITDSEDFVKGVKKIVIDTNGKSLYFSSEYGFGVINDLQRPGAMTYISEKNHSMFVVKDFSIGHKGVLAIALSSGVAIVNNLHDQLEFSMPHLKKGVDFFPHRSYSVFYDKDNTLWFSNRRGLFFYKNGRTGSVTSNVLDKRINDIKQMADGTMLFATDGYGLVMLKDKKVIHHIKQSDGLASNICKKIFVYDDHIWLVTSKGINHIHTESGVPEVEAFEYTSQLLRNDVNDLYIDRDTAYFATNSGLVFFKHSPHHFTKVGPKAIISAITIDEEEVNVGSREVAIEQPNSKISFNYSVINFENQEILFRYRLRSNDRWTETRNRRIDLSSLSPGKYKFELSAKNNTSDWSEPSTFRFYIKARFWQTNWFLLLLFAIGAFSFYRIAVIVTRRQKNKEQQRLLLKNQTLVLEQRALQAMMNPHFVFNVMNSIQHYINTKDTSSANKVLTGFAKLIRKNLEICTKSNVTIEEEIAYLSLYLSLEKNRFGDKLQYEILVAPEIDREETTIPSMLLQPYLENAIWHGIMPLEQGGKLTVSLELQGEETLLIRIIDNGVGIDNSLKHKKFTHTSKGMNLTQERINLINQIEPNQIHIKIQQNGSSGTSVYISIKLI